MAPPLIAATAYLPKAFAAAKALFGFGTKAAAAKTAATAGSTVGKRMAGDVLKQFGKRFMNTMPKKASEIGMRVAPDAIFGTIAGAMTPGDFGDKLIAGTTATVGGAAGGLVGRGLVGAAAPKLLNNQMVDITTEMIGGLTGDMAGQGVADSLLRLKGGGTTPYEKMAAEQQRELEQQILRNYLSGKGGYPTNDYFLQENGLG